MNPLVQTNPPAVMRAIVAIGQPARQMFSTDPSEKEIVEQLFRNGIAKMQRAHENVRQKYPKMFEQ